VLAQQNKLPAAVVEYRRSLQLKPNQPEVQSNLGIAEFKQGHFENTIMVLKQVVRQKPGDQRSAILIGMSYYGLRQYGHAAEFLKPAVQRDPANLELKNVLAQSCLWSRQYDCAMAQFKDMLAINPESAQAHMLMAGRWMEWERPTRRSRS
jgi:cytochrome c-type biogenesis protein CcmH/NrfG